MLGRLVRGGGGVWRRELGVGYSSLGAGEKVSKPRVQRRTRVPATGEEEQETRPGFWSVAAYATAEHYDLARLRSGLLAQGLYMPSKVNSDEEAEERSATAGANAIHAIAKYPVSPEHRHLYYFHEGTLVMWNFTELERRTVLNYLRQFEYQSYPEQLIQMEMEYMRYTYNEAAKRSYIHDGVLVLGTLDKAPEAVSLDRYALSNAIAQSVKLGVMEASLEQYIHDIEHVTGDLKFGRPVRINQEGVLRKSGELFALRHAINLSTDLLDTPDFYWDHDHLELLYQRAINYFSIPRRTRVINEKLNHCLELVQLLSTFLSDRHHVRLEWMIIVLIMVEVGFEVIHYLNAYPGLPSPLPGVHGVLSSSPQHIETVS